MPTLVCCGQVSFWSLRSRGCHDYGKKEPKSKGGKGGVQEPKSKGGKGGVHPENGCIGDTTLHYGCCVLIWKRLIRDYWRESLPGT